MQVQISPEVYSLLPFLLLINGHNSQKNDMGVAIKSNRYELKERLVKNQ